MNQCYLGSEEIKQNRPSNTIGAIVMKWWFSIVILLIILAAIVAPVHAAGGPQVVNRDGKISISADHITLGFLLDLWDKATGMKSTVAPELAGRKLSVHFTGLSEDDAV